MNGIPSRVPVCTFMCLRVELAEHGFRFCTESLEAKLKKQKETPAEEQAGETRWTRTRGSDCQIGLWLVVMVVVFRGAGNPQKGNPPPPGSLFGLASSVPSFNSAPEAGPTGLPERPQHLPAGAGRHPPTGRHPGRTVRR